MGSETHSTDERFMNEAVRLARRGEGWVSPNPMVGAVLVRAGEIVSRGYHRRFGGPHAEREAIGRLEGPLRDATLYVPLEPCSHHGKTPPCTDLIVERGVGRVVVGVLDPNPQVAGSGIRALQESGIDVRVGVLEETCRMLNRTFLHWMERGVPWVTLKWAQSLDGRIATISGHSRWISSEPSRRQAHRLRATHDGVLVGVGTIRRDDPLLTVRHARGRDPIRIILDSELSLPAKARVLSSSSSGAETWIATTDSAGRARIKKFESRGIRIIRCPGDPEGRVNLTHLLADLGARGISSLLVEGGSTVLTAFVRAGLFQRMVCFVAPTLLGKGVEAIQDLGIHRVNEAAPLTLSKVERSGGDLMLDLLVGH